MEPSTPRAAGRLLFLFGVVRLLLFYDWPCARGQIDQLLTR